MISRSRSTAVYVYVQYTQALLHGRALINYLPRVRNVHAAAAGMQHENLTYLPRYRDRACTVTFEFDLVDLEIVVPRCSPQPFKSVFSLW
jgi:hypothetical protein